MRGCMAACEGGVWRHAWKGSQGAYTSGLERSVRMWRMQLRQEYIMYSMQGPCAPYTPHAGMPTARGHSEGHGHATVGQASEGGSTVSGTPTMPPAGTDVLPSRGGGGTRHAVTGGRGARIAHSLHPQHASRLLECHSPGRDRQISCPTAVEFPAFVILPFPQV